MVTWLVLIAGMWLRLVEDVSQLAAGISWENGDTRWLELGCLNHCGTQEHWPGTPTYAVGK